MCTCDGRDELREDGSVLLHLDVQLKILVFLIGLHLVDPAYQSGQRCVEVRPTAHDREGHVGGEELEHLKRAVSFDAFLSAPYCVLTQQRLDVLDLEQSPNVREADGQVTEQVQRGREESLVRAPVLQVRNTKISES